MGKILRCRDVGVDCDTEIRGQTEAEILQKAAEHAKDCHAGVQVTPELQAKLRSLIREDGGSCCGGTCH